MEVDATISSYVNDLWLRTTAVIIKAQHSQLYNILHIDH